jgi:hypothetical protein
MATRQALSARKLSPRTPKHANAAAAVSSSSENDDAEDECILLLP